MKIRDKIVVCLVLSVITAIGGSAVIVFLQSRTDMVSDFGTNGAARIELMGNYITQYSDSMSSVVNVLVAMPDVQDAMGKLKSYVHTSQDTPSNFAAMSESEREIALDFQPFIAAFSACELIYLGTEDGGFIQMPDDTLGAGFDPRTRPWYTQAKAAGKSVISTAPYMSDSGHLVYTVTRSVYDKNGKFVGVLGIDVNFKDITNFLDTVKVGETGHMIMTDATGLIVYDPDDAERMFKTVAAIGNAGLTELYNKGNGVGKIIFEDIPHVVVAGTTPQDWHILMLIEQDELLISAAAIVTRMMFDGLGLVLVLAIAGVLLARSIATPIMRMVEAAEGVADGNLHAVPRTARFSGELGNLHNSMLRMVDQLVALISTSESKTHEAEAAVAQAHESLMMAEEAKLKGEHARREGVEETAKRLEGVVGNLGNASRELDGRSSLISASVSTQRDRTAETATAMGQMNVTVSDVARSAAEASEIAEQAKKESQAGRHTVDDVVSSISEVEKFTRDMSESMGNLVRQAEGIGQVMNIITDVADQTNLLALNAAIEAARAGEAGRGFAVVADEVRKLAEKTMTATQTVGKAIAEIQQGAETNNKLIGRSVEQVQHSTRLAVQAGEALERIERMVVGTADQVRAIAAASEQQSTTSEQVTYHTQDVNQLAGEVALAMELAAQNIASVNTMIGELQTIITSLKAGE